MRVTPWRPMPPPSLIEQLLGRRRAAQLRRRVGVLALGAGFTLLRPRPRRWRVTSTAVAAGVLVLFAVAALALG